MIFSQLIVLINCCAVYNICYKRLKNKQPPKIEATEKLKFELVNKKGV